MITKNQELDKWVAQARTGDEGAFGRVYDHFLNKIFRFVSFRIADREVAKEVTNEIFFEAWRSLKRYDPKRKIKFSTWLFTIARHRIIDQYRRQKEPTVALEDVAELRNEKNDLNEQVIVRDEFATVQKQLQKLPEIQQTVLSLRYLEELSYAEIAKILGESEGNARLIAKRALEILKKVINQDEKR